MTTAVQDRLDLSYTYEDDGGSTVEVTEVEYTKNWLKQNLDLEVENKTIENLLQAAKEQADAFLNNPFRVTKGEIIIGSPDNGEAVSIDGNTFTVASAKSVEDREFSTAQDLADCINSDILTKNKEEIGIPYLDATVDGSTVSLETERRKNPDLSTNSDEIDVQFKRYNQDIPEDVKDAVLRDVARRYYQRVDGLKSENIEHGGGGSMDWGEIRRTYLQQYRRIPGI